MVTQHPWGTWQSYDREGKGLITSLTEEICIEATRWYLKMKQDGFPDETRSYDSVVGGKL